MYTDKNKYDQSNNLVFEPPTNWLHLLIVVSGMLFIILSIMLFYGYRYMLNEPEAVWIEIIKHSLLSVFSKVIVLFVPIITIIYINKILYNSFLMCDGEYIYFAGERWFPMNRISEIIIYEDRKHKAKSIAAVTADNIKMRMPMVFDVDRFVHDMLSRFPLETAHINVQRKKNIFMYTSVQILLMVCAFCFFITISLLAAHYISVLF